MTDEITYITMPSRWDGASYQYYTDKQDSPTNIGVTVTFANGDMLSVPINEENADYMDIAAMLADGDITIQEAEAD